MLAPVGVHHAVGELGQRRRLLEDRERPRGELVATELAFGEQRARCGRSARPRPGGRAARPPSRPGPRGRRGARTARPRSRSTSSRIQPGWFTIAGRPAAKVSKSLLGELVASTGTSLKIVRQASDAAASRATSALSGRGAGTRTLAAPQARASPLSSARRLPSPSSTKVTPGTSGGGAHHLGRGRWPRPGCRSSCTRTRCRARAGARSAARSSAGGEELEVRGVRHQRDRAPAATPAATHAVADPGRERDHPGAAASTRSARGPREALGQRDCGARPSGSAPPARGRAPRTRAARGGARRPAGRGARS